MKTLLKSATGAALLNSGLYPKLYGNSATVVAFHRIDDRYPLDPITTTVDAFRRFCRMFAKRFNVVSLSRLLDDLADGRCLDGSLAITFDDGYRDNYAKAAPILKEFGLPATFFIATGFVGTSSSSWWDERVGIASEWMNWPQVRELHQLGFEMGAHTVRHVDLGKVSGATAVSELRTSRLTLEEELGAPVNLFAYPYGGRDQMSAENLEIVKCEGFRCCASSFGGRVSPLDDPFDLKRIPINGWFETPSQFAFEILLE